MRPQALARRQADKYYRHDRAQTGGGKYAVACTRVLTDRRRFHDGQGLRPVGPHHPRCDPERAIDRDQLRAPAAASGDGELLAEGEVLQEDSPRKRQGRTDQRSMRSGGRRAAPSATSGARQRRNRAAASEHVNQRGGSHVNGPCEPVLEPVAKRGGRALGGYLPAGGTRSRDRTQRGTRPATAACVC